MLNHFYGTGRRKTSVARVFITPVKTGEQSSIIINNQVINDYFSIETARMIVCQPLRILDSLEKFSIKATVKGGGISGQAGALRLAVARALLQQAIKSNVDDEEGVTINKKLRDKGFLTRDARKVERKKFGLRKARKSVQFSKR